MPSFDLQALSDRAEISDVFIRYAWSVDTRDWSSFESCFTADAEIDLTGMHPGVVFSGAKALVAYTSRAISVLHATQHIITNHSCDIDGDTAKCSAYLHGQHVIRNETGEYSNFVIGGYYNYAMVRTGDGWKIRRFSLTITWTAGDGEALQRAMENNK